MDFDGDFVIKLGDYEYSIPLKFLVAQTQFSDTRSDCDIYIAQLKQGDQNVIRLGDVFLSAFLSVYDIE